HHIRPPRCEIKGRVISVERWQEEVFDERVSAAPRIEDTFDHRLISRIDVWPHGMELESERFDERPVELRGRERRMVTPILQREGQADVRVHVAERAPACEEDA